MEKAGRVDERIDEEIGALLDGRVHEERRTELLARLAADDDDYEVFADTAAVLREAEEGASAKVPERVAEDAGAATTKVIPLRPRPATVWRRPAVRVLAAAAVLAAVAVVPVLRSRANAGAWRDPARIVALGSRPIAGLPAEWSQSWSVTRGGGGTAQATGVAARVGTLHMDMVVAAASASTIDTAEVAQLARTAAAILDNADILGIGGVAGEYHGIANSPARSRSELMKRLSLAREDVTAATDEDYFDLGAWTEAARLAAARPDPAFFRASASRKALEKATTLEGLADDAKAAATRILQQGENVADWTSVKRDLDTLQAGLAQ